MKVFAITNSKGGVGKTTLTVNLATGYALAGYSVLVVDADQQGHSTRWLVGPEARDGKGTADALVVESLDDRFLAWAEPNPKAYEGRNFRIAVLPGTTKLERAGLFLGGEKDARDPATFLSLSNVLQERASDFDVVIIDCPPRRDVLVGNAICASDGIIVPLSPSVFGVDGVDQIQQVHMGLRTLFEEMPPILGNVLFAVNPQHTITKQTREALAEDGTLFETEIRTSTKAAALPGLQLSSFGKLEGARGKMAYADQRGAEDYAALMQELRNKTENNARRGAA